jgi:hypothetical protein
MKIKSQLIWIAFLFGVFGLTGCTAPNTPVRARGWGERVTYNATFDEVWGAVPQVITNAGLNYVSGNIDKRVFLARHGITGRSWGENVTIFVEKVEIGKTSVEVITVPKLIPNYTAQDWDGPIFIQLDKRFERD